MTEAQISNESDTSGNDQHEIVVIGAGPAGLTAAYMLSKRGVASTVLEADTVVGGISRTAVRDGWRFDIGGHRFFTKVKAVDDLWFEILGKDDFLRRPRMSRVYYRKKFYDYPLVAKNALMNLGLVEAVRCMGSYAWVRIKPPKDTSTLEGFVASRFGWRLYEHFFKTQSEKVWGVPCTEIQADWGAQRIKDLSIWKAVVEALTPKALKQRRSKGKQITSLIEEFNYPKYGPGMMWERCTELVTERGTKVVMDALVTRVEHADGKANAVTATGGGVTNRYECTEVISSMPISALLRAMDPPVPADVQEAADNLRYRAHITVGLVVPEEFGFPDNWVYINDADVKVGRVQNFGRWSPYLVKDGRTCLGPRAVRQRGRRVVDDVGRRSRRDGQARARADRPPRRVEGRGGLRGAHAEGLPVLRRGVQGERRQAGGLARGTRPNVYPVGRNGMHRYNNQDHSMFTAMLSVENIFGAHHDVWSVNVEEEYHEEKAADDSEGEPRG